ncbi:MAG: hypothetical protein GX847_04695, partial [Clostridiales bacterium]|nr:hypothetical protein [Clostridiales bacterium]
ALGWSKFFNIPAACAAAVLLFGIILIKTNRTKRIAHAAVGIVTLCALAAVYISTPSWMGFQTKYNAIFFGALKDTDAASCERYLSEFGLPRELVRYRNTNIYVEGIAHELIESGYDGDVMAVSNLDIASFYLRHPDRLFYAAAVSLLNAGDIRPFYLSNFDDAAPKLTFSHRFTFWSDVRSAASFDTWLGLAGVILVFALSVFITMKRACRKWYEVLSVFLLSAGILAYFFLVPFMTNGEGDLAKHLFAYAQLTDLMVLFILTSSLHGLSLKKPLPIPAGCLVMALCLAFVPVKTGISHMLSLNRLYDAPEKGAYITFGTHAGSNLLWQVTEKDNGVMTLLCARNVAHEQFSTDGGNGWQASSLRQWLNTSFLSSFSDFERSRLLPADNTVLLSRETKGAAVSGNRDFYFSPVPTLASRGYDEAYQTVTQDMVALPDIDLISDLSADGTAIFLSEAYWLDTPYFNNGYMVRCVVPNGRILMREASEQAGVRPVIHIEAAAPVSGTGTYKDPFILK